MVIHLALPSCRDARVSRQRRIGVTSRRQEDAVTDARDDRPFVLRSFDDGVLTLTLNRGERFNPVVSQDSADVV